MQILVKSPRECNESEIDTFIKMTEEGGQVSIFQLRDKVLRAKKLVFVIVDDKCVAIAALKRPFTAYKNKVFRAAGVEDMLPIYGLEIGYIYAVERGIANQLMDTVLKSSEGAMVFATTRTSNGAMQYLLPKYGLKKVGQSFQSNLGDYLLELFVNEV